MNKVLLAVIAFALGGCMQFDVRDEKGIDMKGIPVKSPDGKTVYVNMRRTPWGKDNVTIKMENGAVTEITAGTETSSSPLPDVSDVLEIIPLIAVGAAVR